ncbi:MAG: hypothetical protein KF824_10255 [Fimbriimonadaceae bacterium]|nr:MAG: hypothetical protein KF824_10255 [Fimbriimonadaceae bacterium]
MRVFFSTGEASGDAYAAALANRISGFVGEMEGAIGAKGDLAGIKRIADNRNWGSIGIYESLKVAPLVLRGYWSVLRALRSGTPGLCICVDYGFFNIKVARHAKAAGWKVLYFIPPGSWRKDKQGTDLPQITDQIVTPFEWSAKILNEMGANAHWFGHPLKQMVAESSALSSTRSGIAVLPGSRLHEIENNIPTIAQALKNYDGEILLSQAPNVSGTDLLGIWQKHGKQEPKLITDVYSALKSAEAAVVCSGTATLECALCGCPQVVVYRGNKVMELEAKIRKPKFDFVSLPNILLGRGLLTELIQWDATPERIWNEVDGLLHDSAKREEQLAGYKELDTILGGADCLNQTAEMIRKMVSPS